MVKASLFLAAAMLWLNAFMGIGELWDGLGLAFVLISSGAHSSSPTAFVQGLVSAIITLVSLPTTWKIVGGAVLVKLALD